MVAKFFDDNKLIIITNNFISIALLSYVQTENLLKKRIRTVLNFIDLIQFHLISQKVANFSGLNPKGPYLSQDWRKQKFLCCIQLLHEAGAWN